MGIPASGAQELQTPVKTVLEGAALRTAVLEYLKTEGDGRPEGLEFEAVCTRFQLAASASVREALDFLVDAGDVFTTIDDRTTHVCDGIEWPVLFEHSWGEMLYLA